MSDFDELMTQQASIVRNTTGVDSFGVVRPSWSTLYSDISCSIQENAGTVRPTGTGAYLSFDAHAYFDYSVDIRPGTQANQNSPDAIIWNGRTYLVMAVIDESGTQDHWTVYLKRLPGPTSLPGSGSGIAV